MAAIAFRAADLCAQYATFYADTTRLPMKFGVQGEFYDSLFGQEWLIDGQSLRFGSAPIQIKTGSEPKIVQYRASTDLPWISMLCIVNQAQSYRFLYNECCNAFHIADSQGLIIRPKLVFEFNRKRHRQTWLGYLGQTGILAKGKVSDTLWPLCYSPMLPNVFEVGLRLIQPCMDSAQCEDEICLISGNDSVYNYGYGYRVLQPVVSFMYLPLSREPLRVRYDFRKGNVLIR
jgi:hypothetical protein